MTTQYLESAACAICGAANDVIVVSSTHSFGAMDLDTRPAPMMRDTLGAQIQKCRGCGFCSSDITSSAGIDVSLVQTDAYRQLLHDPRFPDLARQFRAHGYLVEAAGSLQTAARAQLSAAWVCDDKAGDDPTAAETCREDTLRLFALLHDRSTSFGADLATDRILSLDLLRRTRQFAAVATLAADLRTGRLPEILDQVALFQQHLALARDTSCRTVKDAMQHAR